MAGTISPIWAAPGQQTVAAVAAAVRELQQGAPLRSVIVLTPPGSTAATLRRLLPATVTPAGGTIGIAGIRFSTVPDLALDLAPLAVRRSRPITPLLLTAAVHAELDERCPAALEPVRRHPATIDALVHAANRLRSVRLADDEATARAELTHGQPVRRALLDVAGAARARLLQRGFRDEAQVIGAAMSALQKGTSTIAAPVVVVATDVVHPAQLRFVRSVLRYAPAARVVASPPVADDLDLAAQLIDLFGLFGAAPPVDASAPSVPTVVSSPDPDEEARWVVRTVVEAIAGAPGGPALGAPAPTAMPEDIVVLYPPASGYARSLRDEFARAGVVTSGPAVELLRGSMAGQVLRLLLDLFDEGSDRERVLHLVAVAPRWTNERALPRPVAAWRRLCRTAGVVLERDWDDAIDRLRSAFEARRVRRQRFAPTEPSAPPNGHSSGDQRDLDSLGRLVQLVGSIRRSATAYRRSTTWTAAATALADELGHHIGDVRWRATHWADAPVWQRRAADQVETLVHALAQFDDERTRVPFDRGALRRIIQSELQQQVRKAGDTAVGVRLLPLQHGVCLDARRVFVVGANEGVLPPPRTDDLVVPSELGDVAASVVEHADWQRHRLTRAWNGLLRSGADVTVTWARTDLRRGGAMYPSSWVAGIPIEIHPSHASGVLDLAPLTAAECAARRVTTASMVAASTQLQRRAIALTARAADQAGEFEGWIGAHPEHDPRRTVQAITRYEEHALCGLDSFVKRVLGVDTDTDPSEIVEIEPRDRGNLVHGVVEQLVLEWLALPARRQPAWLQGEHFDATVRRAEQLIDVEARRLAAEHRLGHPTSWRIERTMLLRALRATLRREADEACTPIAAEQAFGFDDSTWPAQRLAIDDFGDVSFRGKIDRIDQLGGAAGTSTWRVTDFKTSRAAQVRTHSDDAVARGEYLQPGLYSSVVQREHAGGPVTGQYVFLRRDASEVVAFRDEWVDVLHEAVSRIAVAMHDGDFRPKQPGVWGCNTCSPDGLGLGDVTARAARWLVGIAESGESAEPIGDAG